MFFLLSDSSYYGFRVTFEIFQTGTSININAVQNVSRFFACVFLSELTFPRSENWTFDFQKQRGVYLSKSFYLEKLRVSYFENKRNYKLFFDWKTILILNYIFRRLVKFLRAVSHAEKRAPVSDWRLHLQLT